MKDDAAPYMTTQQLAHMWHVSEATIKRWSDAGHLRSQKTIGGHRRFALAEVARFQNERGLGAGTQVGKALRGPAVSKALKAGRAGSEQFFEAIADGREAAATAILLKSYLDKVPLVKIMDETVTGALHHVGDEWSGGEMTVADEHLATRTAVRALESLGSLLKRESTTGKTAICCAVEGELHDVALLCAQISLEGEGWQVKNLGANTPFFALTDMIEKRGTELVCVSSTISYLLDRASREYAQLRETAAQRGARIIIGGEGFREEIMRRRFPAALYAESFSQLVEVVREM